MSSSSDQLDHMLSQYPWPSQYPDIRQLRQLLRDVTHDEKVEILKRHDPLFRAALLGHTEIITTILSSIPQHQRLDVLLVDDYTPLHTAAYCGESDCVNTILTHLTPEQQLKILSVRFRGWTLRDDEGETAADTASLHGEQETERLLRGYKLRAERPTGGILMKLKQFLIGSNDLLKGGTAHGNIKDGKDAALLLYSRVGREEGAVKEADILESGFRKQGSHVTRYEWITACDLQDKLHTFIQAVSSDCQMMFVCVMSHGAPGVLCGAVGVKLPLNDLLDQLKALPAKLPLVMLVQACQNANTEPFRQSVELDAKFQATDASRASPPESSLCPHIDLTRPHTVLLRSTVTGGYSRRGAYTEALAHQIGSADGFKSIHEMHEDAVKAMRRKFGVEYVEEISQVPEYRDTLQGEKLVLKKAANQ